MRSKTSHSYLHNSFFLSFVPDKFIRRLIEGRVCKSFVTSWSKHNLPRLNEFLQLTHGPVKFRANYTEFPQTALNNSARKLQKLIECNCGSIFFPCKTNWNNRFHGIIVARLTFIQNVSKASVVRELYPTSTQTTFCSMCEIYTLIVPLGTNKCYLAL